MPTSAGQNQLVLPGGGTTPRGRSRSRSTAPTPPIAAPSSAGSAPRIASRCEARRPKRPDAPRPSRRTLSPSRPSSRGAASWISDEAELLFSPAKRATAAATFSLRAPKSSDTSVPARFADAGRRSPTRLVGSRNTVPSFDGSVTSAKS